MKAVTDGKFEYVRNCAKGYPFPPERCRGETCCFTEQHDPVTLAPLGPRCGAPAVQVIYWQDKRFSPACRQHGEKALTAEAWRQVLHVVEIPIAQKENAG